MLTQIKLRSRVLRRTDHGTGQTRAHHQHLIAGRADLSLQYTVWCRKGCGALSFMFLMTITEQFSLDLETKTNEPNTNRVSEVLFGYTKTGVILLDLKLFIYRCRCFDFNFNLSGEQNSLSCTQPIKLRLNRL